MMLNIFYFYLFIHGVYSFWNNEKDCPVSCTCRVQHITEANAYRFTQQNKEVDKHHSEANIHENNDVYYDEDFIANFDQDKSFLRSAICVIQTETEIENLLQSLPKDINSLALIQGSDSGNKTIKFSYLLEFQYLMVLELQGVSIEERSNVSRLICEIDVALPILEYINLEKVDLKGTARKHSIIGNGMVDEFVTYDYVQKINPLSKPLSFIRSGIPVEILPYNKYIEEKSVSFKGFSSLTLLRVFSCDFNHLHWEMFEGLNNLVYLLLENNNLKFIPDFAFYGTANVKTLSLAHNNLLNIQVRNLAGLLELEYLDLSYNNFSQLSELSLPPFPKLKLANFGDNPINAIFPNTFEVMNTTDSIILGGEETRLTILTNSFLGLKSLKKLTIRNLQMASLEKDFFVGMPNLNELVLTGDIPKIQFDAFLEVYNLESLILNKCNISKISIDGFMGLNKLKVLDLSRNNLEYLPHGIFDVLANLKELYLNNNKFKELPKAMFSNTQLRLIRLSNNPWHCSCDMSDWKPVLINRIKQKTGNGCHQAFDKGLACGDSKNLLTFKYMYENRVAPTCTTPKKFLNWNVFHVLRKQLKCTDFKPKFKKTKLLKNQKLKKVNAIQSIATSKSTVIDVTTAKIRTTPAEMLENATNDYPSKDILNEINVRDPYVNKVTYPVDNKEVRESGGNSIKESINQNESNNLEPLTSKIQSYPSNNFENNLTSMNTVNYVAERSRKPSKRRYRKKMYKQNIYGKIKKVDM